MEVGVTAFFCLNKKYILLESVVLLGEWCGARILSILLYPILC